MSRVLDENSSVDTWVYTTPRKLKRSENAKRRDYYVYVLIRRTGVPIYVGKGRSKRATRDFTKEGENFHLRSMILKDREAGYPEPSVLMAGENLLEQESFELEMHTIARYGRVVHGGTLANMTGGGPGEVEGREAARVTKQFLHCQQLAIENRTRAPLYDLDECLGGLASMS